MVRTRGSYSPLVTDAVSFSSGGCAPRIPPTRSLAGTPKSPAPLAWLTRCRSFALITATDRGTKQRPGSLQVFPGVALAVGTAQQERRVEGRNQLGAAEIEDAAAQARDRVVAPEQRLRGERAERHDHARADGVDLLEEERLARRDLVRLGIAVPRRAAFDHVGDVDLIALEIDRQDHLRQELTGLADKRDPLLVFVRARRLTDEHQVRVGVADAEHDLLPPEPRQLAARTVGPNLNLDRGEAFRASPGYLNNRTGSRKLGAGSRRPIAVRRSRSPPRIRTHSRDPEVANEAEVLGGLLPEVGHALTACPEPGRGACPEPGRRARDARSCSIRSRIFDASSVLSCIGCSTSPSAEMNTAALVSLSKPAPSRETSLATIRSTCFAASFFRARGRGSPVSAANPTSTGVPASPRAWPSSARMSGVRTKVNVSGPSPFAIFASAAPDCGV